MSHIFPICFLVLCSYSILGCPTECPAPAGKLCRCVSDEEMKRASEQRPRLVVEASGVFGAIRSVI